MFGIGGPELLVIFVVALLVLGPNKLPELARTLGRAMSEVRRVSTEFQRTLHAQSALDELRRENRQDGARQPGPGDGQDGQNGQNQSVPARDNARDTDRV
jgi:Tat protein translocase TatB subunit